MFVVRKVGLETCHFSITWVFKCPDPLLQWRQRAQVLSRTLTITAHKFAKCVGREIGCFCRSFSLITKSRKT